MRESALGAGVVAPSQSALPPFALHRPDTLAEAESLVRELPGACIAAGTTDLIAQVREGRSPTEVISVRRVAELQSATYADGVLRLGAGLTHAAAAGDPVLRRTIPSLADAWAKIATVRIRFSGTLGGNLMARRFRYELPVLLGALGAELDFVAAAAQAPASPAALWPAGADTADGASAGAWEPVGLLRSVTVGTRDLLWFGYDRTHRPTATVALAVRAADGGLQVTAVAGSEYRRPFHLVVSEPVDELAAVDAPATGRVLAAQLPDTAADRVASLEYRRHLVAVLAARLLAAAQGEAR